MPRIASLLPGLLVFLLGLGSVGHDPAPDDPLLLVANKNGHSLYFVNPTSGQITDSVPTGKNPHEVAAAPDAERAYVANYAGGTISVVDVATRTVVEQWPLEGYSHLHGIQVGPDEERVYVTAEDQQAVLEIDASSGMVQRVFETGKEVTHMLALTPEASTLYATSIGSGTASKIDLETGRAVAHAETGNGAEGVALTPDGEEVWVTNRADDTVSILDASTATVVDSLSVEGFPIRVAVSPGGRRAVVSCPRAGDIALFDANERRLVTRLDVGEMPIGVVIPNESRAFVANAGAGTVSVVDLNTQTVVDTIPAGYGPDGMAYIPAE